MHRATCAAILLLVTALSGSAGGLVIYQSVEELAGQADRIVIGRVTEIDSAFNDAHTVITSRVWIDVLADLKGDGLNPLELKVLGGRVDELTMWTSVTPVFEVNDQALIFLQGDRLAGEWQGAYLTNGLQVEQMSSGAGLRTRPGTREPLNDLLDQIRGTIGPAQYQAPDLACLRFEPLPSDLRWTWQGRSWNYMVRPMGEVYYVTGDCEDASCGSPAQQVATIKAAAESWYNVGANFQFPFGGEVPAKWGFDGDNHVFFVQGEALGQTTVGVTTIWGNPPTIVEWDLMFNDEYHTFWNNLGPCNNMIDLQSVTVHELGHALGLDHTDVSGSVMWPSIRACADVRHLSSDDRDGVLTLYGPAWTSLCDYSTTIRLSLDTTSEAVEIPPGRGVVDRYGGCSTSYIGNELPFVFTPPKSGRYLIRPIVSGGQAAFFLMSNCGTPSATVFGDCWTSEPRSAQLNGGSLYYLIADRTETTGLTAVQVRIEAEEVLCDVAVPIELGQQRTATCPSGSGTVDQYNGCGTSYPGTEAVFSFHPPTADRYVIEPTVQAGQVDFFLLTDCADSETSYFRNCWDDGPRSLLLSPGTTYYIVGDRPSTTGSASWSLRIALEASTLNCDDGAVALTLGCAEQLTIPSGYGAVETYADCDGSFPGREGVFTFRPSESYSYRIEAHEVSGRVGFFLLSDCDPSANHLGSCWNGQAQVVRLNRGQRYILVADKTSTSGEAVVQARVDRLEPVALLAAQSVISHGSAGVYALDLLSNNLEPRANGVQRIDLQVDQPLNQDTVTAEHVQVRCQPTDYDGRLTATLSRQTTIILTFDPPLPNATCCTIELVDMVSASGAPLAEQFTVRPLAGDVNRDGGVTTSDTALIKPAFQQPVGVSNFLFDYTTDGVISSSDAATIKPRYQQQAPRCPYVPVGFGRLQPALPGSFAADWFSVRPWASLSCIEARARSSRRRC